MATATPVDQPSREQRRRRCRCGATLTASAPPTASRSALDQLADLFDALHSQCRATADRPYFDQPAPLFELNPQEDPR